jgi:uncharacterized delta-60 repeat protein
MQKLNTLLLAAVSAGCCTAGLAGGGLGMPTHDARVGAAASPTRDEAYAVAIQRDGKLLVAGWSTVGGGGDFALARYTNRGVLDPRFGKGGLVVTGFGESPRKDQAWAVVVQRDGRIVVAGESGEVGHEDIALARYLANGRLDTTFGTGGKVLTDLGSSSADIAYALAIQRDGKILVAGESDAGGNVQYAIVRYTASGAVDASFGDAGRVLTGFGGTGEGDSALAVAVQTDGRILAAGQSDVADSCHLSLARYTHDGRLDASFGNGGRVLTPLGTTYYWAVDATIQTDGKIVASAVDDGEDFVVARYARNGRPDPGFGKKGMVATDFAKASSDVPFAIAMQGRKTVVAGYYESANEDFNFEFALARYTPKGRLDSTFGRRGKVLTDFGGSSVDMALDAAIDGSRRIVAVGTRQRNRTSDFAVARYTADGHLDRAFGRHGRTLTDFASLG